MITQRERQRAYQVMMHALVQEIRVCGLSQQEQRQRSREIWNHCFGDAKKHDEPFNKRDDGRRRREERLHKHKQRDLFS